MPVIARDAVASDHLVYAWPLPIGPEECEVSCAEDELVVMCPAWLVGDRLGPGRHRWRTPDPTRPVGAYFVLTAPVDVSFDVMTQFVIPMTGQPVRLRANGSIQVRCADPTLLVAQFVGLPFDSVNDGVLRSVSRSIERMLARLLTRRVVMAGTPQAVTDPQMLANIVDELIAYNPTAGAVFGIELVRFGHLQVFADDGSQPWHQLGSDHGVPPPHAPVVEDRTETKKTVQQAVVAVPTTNPNRAKAKTDPPPLVAPPAPVPPPVPVSSGPPSSVSGEIVAKPKPAKPTSPGVVPPSGSPTMQTPVVPPPIPAPPSAASSGPMAAASSGSIPAAPASSTVSSSTSATASGVVSAAPRRASSSPAVTPDSGAVVSGEIGAKKPAASRGDDVAFAQGTPTPQTARGGADGDSRGAILGIGVAHIGSSEVVGGEITKKIAPGGRVLVPGPNGLMQSATVRQLLQGYYELEVGGSGETIWVPVNGVVPE